jgi:phenylpyruvate tautomerase PptA (4-oxalocrotonate tautomerase family)
MPFINVKFVDGIWNEDEQAELAVALQEAVVSVRGPHANNVTTVVMEGVREGGWYLPGGKVLKVDGARAAYDSANNAET